MRIICTSEWHLGNLFHENGRLEEHKHFLRGSLRVSRISSQLEIYPQHGV